MVLRTADQCAAVDNCLLLMGGRTSELGWFRSRTETYHNDVVTVDFSIGPQWKQQEAQGEHPQPREFHTLSPISGGRLLLFGGVGRLASWELAGCMAVKYVLDQ